MSDDKRSGSYDQAPHSFAAAELQQGPVGDPCVSVPAGFSTGSGINSSETEPFAGTLVSTSTAAASLAPLSPADDERQPAPAEELIAQAKVPGLPDARVAEAHAGPAGTMASSLTAGAEAHIDSTPQPQPSPEQRSYGVGGSALPRSATQLSGLQRQPSDARTPPAQQPKAASGQSRILGSFRARSLTTWRDGCSPAEQATASTDVRFSAFWDGEAFIEAAVQRLSPGTHARGTLSPSDVGSRTASG